MTATSSGNVVVPALPLMRFVCACGEKAVEERIVITAEEIAGQNDGKWTKLVRERRALVCPKDGVIAWYGDEAIPSK